MNNDNYWKDRYQHLWQQSSQKEKLLREIIQAETGLLLRPTGLGAESAEYIPGSAKVNNNEKGSPDFEVCGTNVFIEVTGPISRSARPENGLWLRPDKLNYAFLHKKEIEDFFALFFPSTDRWYIIHANQAFFDHVKKHKGKDDYYERRPVIRGFSERYIEIAFNNPFIKDLDYLISFLSER